MPAEISNNRIVELALSFEPVGPDGRPITVETLRSSFGLEVRPDGNYIAPGLPDDLSTLRWKFVPVAPKVTTAPRRSLPAGSPRARTRRSSRRNGSRAGPDADPSREPDDLAAPDGGAA